VVAMLLFSLPAAFPFFPPVPTPASASLVVLVMFLLFAVMMAGRAG